MLVVANCQRARSFVICGGSKLVVGRMTSPGLGDSSRLVALGAPVSRAHMVA